MATVSFANDIAPTLFKYRGQMAWRVDLAKYEDVRKNASIIWGQIDYAPGQQPGMPPPPFEPFDQAFLAAFKAWMDQGYPP